METFARNQEQMRPYLEDAFGGFFPFRQIEDMGKTNMAMFQRAMEMFTPFAPGPTDEGAAAADDRESELAELRLRLNAMQRQLDDIAKKGS
jgi:polyhydroxyalkanoate synthesis regulator protein